LKGCGSEPPAFAGLTEPSLIFLTGTEALLSYPSLLGEALATNKASVAFVSLNRSQEFERAFLEKAGHEPRRLGCVDGIHLNGQGPTRLHIYARPETAGLAGCAPSPAIACREKGETRWRRLFDVTFSN
jgi:hypothetical protein